MALASVDAAPLRVVASTKKPSALAPWAAVIDVKVSITSGESERQSMTSAVQHFQEQNQHQQGLLRRRRH